MPKLSRRMFVLKKKHVVISDLTAPVPISASVSSSNLSRIILTFSEALNSSFVPAISAFTVAGKTVSAVSLSSNVANVDVTVAYGSNEAGSIGYTQPGSNGLRDAAANLVVTFAAQSFTAPSVSTLVPLTFATRTANITEAGDGSGLTATSPTYATTFALSDYKFPAGQDGYVQWDYSVVLDDRDILLGLNTSATNQGFSGYEYFTWVGGADAGVRSGTNGATGSTIHVTATLGDKIRIGRFAGVIKAGRSTDGGSTWVDYRTWNADASEFFINCAMNRLRLKNPKIFGGVLR